MTTRNRTFLTLAVVAMACFALTTSANAAMVIHHGSAFVPTDVSDFLLDPATNVYAINHCCPK